MRHAVTLAALLLAAAPAAAQGLELEYRPSLRLRLPEPGGFPQGPPTFLTQPQQYGRPSVSEGATFAAPRGYGCAGGGGPVYLGSFDVDQRGQYLGGTGLGPQLFGLMFAQQQQGYGAPPTSLYGASPAGFANGSNGYGYAIPASYGYNGNGNGNGGFRTYQSPYNGGYNGAGYGGGYGVPQAYAGNGGGAYCPPGLR